MLMPTGIVNTRTNQGLKHRSFIRDMKAKEKKKEKNRNTIENLSERKIEKIE